ncbi:MAG: acetate uptake transporter [Candidatus Thermoplasmatota archaeon]|nr:acetate uptake transporter [Candidatus Thermoplasmatota archaeon]
MTEKELAKPVALGLGGFALTMGIIVPVPASGLAVLPIAWGIFTGYMMIGSLRLSKGIAVIFITLAILFFLLVVGEFNQSVKIIAGYEGIFCALCAWYCSAAVLLERCYGREVLPLGKVKK